MLRLININLDPLNNQINMINHNTNQINSNFNNLLMDNKHLSKQPTFNKFSIPNKLDHKLCLLQSILGQLNQFICNNKDRLVPKEQLELDQAKSLAVYNNSEPEIINFKHKPVLNRV